MRRICKAAVLVVLAGSYSLPAFSSIAAWQFAGTTYDVQWNDNNVEVNLTRDNTVNESIIKAECRSALTLPVRAKTEREIIAAGVITQPRWQNWPFADVSVEIDNLRYSNVTATSATCKGDISISNMEKDLERTAFLYAQFFAETSDWDSLRAVAPKLLKLPEFSNDTAGLITVMLAEIKPEQSRSYYQEYVASNNISRNETKSLLARWLWRSGYLHESLRMVEKCQSDECQYIYENVSIQLLETEANSVDDLGAYLN
ncbi:hypothetical protein G5S52_09355 [Grimontia sp. S25]|uniref:Uncharacterized protein n=1 Tax=Grimontia sedimenti TaxID=2711294 RepID=A0A6M1RCC4_9GAMM|nr:hypothetical protein [Grimontia sedimenti]NGN97856.1 hypothetical protein [Grimontia sedimenti]